MSGREFKPADVALVQFRTRDMARAETHRGIRWIGGWLIADSGGMYEVVHDSAVRLTVPLLVLDRDDRPQMERFADAVFEQEDESATAVAAAVRSLLEPPKPPEPQGLGAVVEDENDRRWVLVDENRGHPWRPSDASVGNTFRAYADIRVVRILSEGVQP